jgi:hypothetical protein
LALVPGDLDGLILYDLHTAHVRRFDVPRASRVLCA